MKALFIALPLVPLLLAGCGESNPSLGDRPSAASGSSNAVTDYFQSAAQAQKRAVKTIDVVGINKAIESFYVQEGRFPKSLEDLVEKGFLRSLPSPPPGLKFNYDTNSGIFTLEKDLEQDLPPAEKP